MELFLYRNSTTNTALIDASDAVHYKIETPFKFVGRVTTIHKVVPSDRNSEAFSTNSSSLLDRSSVQCDSTVNEKTMELAEIRWRFLAPSALRFSAFEFDMSDYMPSEGIFRR
jgi:hypothetical protein